MKVFSTQPGVQLFTMNAPREIPGKLGSVYGQYSGFCLETQHLPDTPNKSGFPPAVFGPGVDYHEKTLFSFDW